MILLLEKQRWNSFVTEELFTVSLQLTMSPGYKQRTLSCKIHQPSTSMDIFFSPSKWEDKIMSVKSVSEWTWCFVYLWHEKKVWSHNLWFPCNLHNCTQNDTCITTPGPHVNKEATNMRSWNSRKLNFWFHFIFSVCVCVCVIWGGGGGGWRDENSDGYACV